MKTKNNYPNFHQVRTKSVVAQDSYQEVEASIEAIIKTVRCWSETQSAIVEILGVNQKMLRELGAWTSIENILANTAENYFDALLPMVFDAADIDVKPLKEKILALTAAFAEFHEPSSEMTRKAS